MIRASALRRVHINGDTAKKQDGGDCVDGVYFTILPQTAVPRPIVGQLPSLLGSALLALASVAMTTWIVMPLLSWVFRLWKYPSEKRMINSNAVSDMNPEDMMR